MAGQVETPRLMLRQFEERDSLDLLEYLSQPITNCFASNKTTSIEDGTPKYEDTMQYASIFRAVLILIIRLL